MCRNVNVNFCESDMFQLSLPTKFCSQVWLEAFSEPGSKLYLDCSVWTISLYCVVPVADASGLNSCTGAEAISRNAS